MTGMTRESVNKHLGIWRDAGWILFSGGSVTLINAGALADLLRDDEQGRSEPETDRGADGVSRYG